MLRRVPIHRVSNRPNLVLGGDRELVMFVCLLIGIAVFGGFSAHMFLMSLILFTIAALLWFVLIPMLRIMAKSEPHMFKVYMKHMRYPAYCPASSTPFRETKKERKPY